MDIKKINLENDKITKIIKKPYHSPKVNSEELIGFGALCNGVVTGGRKASTGAPNFCKSGRLLS